MPVGKSTGERLAIVGGLLAVMLLGLGLLMSRGCTGALARWSTRHAANVAEEDAEASRQVTERLKQQALEMQQKNAVEPDPPDVKRESSN